MGRKIDIGGYFEQMTRGARGGRRLESDTSADDYPTEPRGESRQPSRSDAGPPPDSGSLKDRLRDILVRGREAAQRTTERVRPRTTPTTTQAPAQAPARGGSGSRGGLAPGGVVSIEYAPKMDGDPDPGDVVWVWVPFEEDPSQGKDRPTVVIGRRGPKLVGVPLTTKRDDREAQIEVGVGDWDPKRRVSYARVWRMLDIDPSEMRREGAVIDRRRFDQIVAAVDHYYDVKLPSAPKPKAAPKRNQKRDTIDYDY